MKKPCLLLLVFTLLFVSSHTAIATVIVTTNTNTVLNAIGVPDGTTATYTGNATAIGYSDSELAGFPFGDDDDFGILSTGIVTQITNANTSGSQGTDLPPAGTSGDKATLNLTLDVPDDARAIGFNFTFLSEEYPEFVGTQFNDKFRALLNDQNIALDVNGDAIEVNNNYFDSSLTPTGTFFDGQTSPLAIRAALPENSQGGTVTLSFSIEDAGDGIYDSAVFLDNLEFYYPQVVYLEFGAATVDIPHVTGDLTFLKPDAGLNDTEITQIVNNLETIYDDFLFEFTTDLPTEGEFSTINVGGTVANLPTAAQAVFSGGVLGVASDIDLGNENLDDYALVFSGESYYDNDIPALSQVVAHELGHILGLFHVEPTDELMYPYANGAPTDIENGDVNRAEINQINGNVEANGITQNSYEELLRNVGLSDSSIVISSLGNEEILATPINFSFDDLFSTIYNAKLGIRMTHDAFPSIFELGDIDTDQGIAITVPMLDQFTVFLVGSSFAEGPVDIFSSSSMDNLTGLSIEELNAYIMGQNSLLSSGINLELFKWIEGSGYSEFGAVAITSSNTPVPEPTTIILFSIGLLGLAGINRKRTN